jgi:hypothetical protein
MSQAKQPPPYHKPPPWFRFYNEVLSDRKIRRISTRTGQPKVVIVGFWATLMVFASESPQRGKLIFGDELLPVELDDMVDETGLDREICQALIDEFMALGMVRIEDGIFTLPNWGKRQFKTDHDGAERQKRSRARKRAAAAKQERSGGGKVDSGYTKESNNGVTSQNKNVTPPESDTESDTESEKEEITPFFPDNHQSHVDKSLIEQYDDPAEQVGSHLFQGINGQGASLPKKEAQKTRWIKAGRDLIAATDEPDIRELCLSIDLWFDDPPKEDRWQRDRAAHPWAANDFIAKFHFARIRAPAASEAWPEPELPPPPTACQQLWQEVLEQTPQFANILNQCDLGQENGHYIIYAPETTLEIIKNRGAVRNGIERGLVQAAQGDVEIQFEAKVS